MSSTSTSRLTMKFFKNSIPLLPGSITILDKPTSTLEVFFNLGYYLLYVPFYIKWNPSLNQYSVHYVKAQRCNSFIIYIFLFHLYLFDTSTQYQRFVSNDGSLLSAIFDMASTLGSYSLSFLFFKMVWFEPRKGIESFLNSTATKNPYPFLSGFFKIFVIVGFSVLGYLYINEFFTKWSKSATDNSIDHLYYITISQHMLDQPCIKYFGTILQTNLMLFYFLVHSFLLAPSCCLLHMAKEFDKHLFA